MAQAFRSTRVLTREGLRPATLIVKGETIDSVRAWGEVPADAPLTDFADLVLLPGLVDSHVHINDPGRDWEGFSTATRAAASGGVTTLVDMPLNCIPETITVAALQDKRATASNHAHVDWAAWGGVVRGNAAELPALVRAGVAGFKCFLIHSGIDGFASVDESDLRPALEALRNTGLPLLAHAELSAPVDAATAALTANNADFRAYATYLTSRPDAAELDAITLLIRLAEEFNAHIHIVHLSSAEAIPMLAAARARGLRITVETCTHYLWFAAEDIPGSATEYKCAPPIRPAANRDALWRALEEGIIDFVATDHSPCPPAMKQREQGQFNQAWGGIASLGLALPVVWTAMQQRGLPLDHIATWMSERPAHLAGLVRKGALASGLDADFAVFDPDAAWTVTASDLHFRHKLSPYLGAHLRGRVHETWLRGTCIFRNNTFPAPPHGREQVRA
jgi:allantoinase